ncbi:hypothetical protein BDR26DRAFT_465322 [Obelidium mucronatum]|nr:hypothetical protein BDR26DRAFT_465322 [Obelidium mucronatum]
MIRYTPLVFAATIASVWVAQKYLPQIGSEIVSRILAETSELICRLHQESHQQSLMIADLSDRVKTTQESLDRVYDSIFQTEQLIRHQTLLIQNLSDSVEQLR